MKKKRKFPPGIQPRDNHWWISYTVDGVRKRRSVGPCDSVPIDDAVKARANSISDAIRTGENIAPKKRAALTLNGLRARYCESLPAGGRSALKVPQYFHHLERVLGGETPLDQVSHVALVRYRSQRQKEQVGCEGRKALTSASHVSHELSCLRAAVNWAERSGLPIGKGNAFRRLTRADRKGVFPAIPPKPPAVLSDEDVEAICGEMTRTFCGPGKKGGRIVPLPHYQRLVRFLYRTGMRFGEARGLTWDCVFEKEAVPHVLLPQTKGGRPRLVPLGREALAVLRECPRTSDRVFTGARGGPLSDIARAWLDARRKAGFPKARLHDLRHSFASHFIERGGDVAALRDICGWRDLSVPSRYVHSSMGRALAVLNRGTVLPFGARGHDPGTMEKEEAG